MKYKLIVLDVDGTMLNSNREVTKRTVQTLRRVQQMGIKIALASGRPTYGILPLAREIDLGVYGGYIISYNGAQVMEAQTGQIIFERRIDPQMVPYLEKKARKMGFTMAYYDGDEVVSDDISNPHVVDEAALNGMTLRQDDILSLSMDDWPAEIMLVSDDEEALTSLEQHMQRHLCVHPARLALPNRSSHLCRADPAGIR